MVQLTPLLTAESPLQLTLVEPQTGLSIRRLADAVGSAWNVEARARDVGRLLHTAPAPVIQPFTGETHE